MAGFQTSINGRFWASAEVEYRQYHLSRSSFHSRSDAAGSRDEIADFPRLLVTPAALAGGHAKCAMDLDEVVREVRGYAYNMSDNDDGGDKGNTDIKRAIDALLRVQSEFAAITDVWKQCLTTVQVVPGVKDIAPWNAVLTPMVDQWALIAPHVSAARTAIQTTIDKIGTDWIETHEALTRTIESALPGCLEQWVTGLGSGLAHAAEAVLRRI
jgi:hypothetical protein